MRGLATIGFTLALLLGLSTAARSQERSFETDPASGDGAVGEQSQVAADPVRGAPAERPFLYLLDPQLPAVGESTVQAQTLATTASGGLRPIGAGSHDATWVQGFQIEHAFTTRLAPLAEVLVAPDSGNTAAALQVGARVLLSDPQDHGFHLTLQASALRALDATWGGMVELTGSVDIGRIRLAAMGHAEKLWGQGRDALDLFAAAGVTYAVLPSLRAGVEYFGQDLEEVFADGAEGGMQSFVGPTVAWTVVRALSIAAGPSLGFGNGTGLAGRATATYRF